VSVSPACECDIVTRVLAKRSVLAKLIYTLHPAADQAEPSPTTGITMPPLFHGDLIPRMTGGDCVDKRFKSTPSSLSNPGTLGLEQQVRKPSPCVVVLEKAEK
jgi:hypothetical protein